MARQKINPQFQVGPEEDEGSVNNGEALMALPAGDGRRREGDSGRGQPGPGGAAAAAAAAAAEVAVEGEGAEEAGAAAGDAGFMLHWNQEGLGATGCDQENEKQPEEPVPDYMGDSENVKPVPGQGSCANPVRVLVPECRPRAQHRFTLLQLQELEGIFQRNQYISSSEAKRLARSMGVSEAKVQKWFLKRREKYRSYKRL
ncbi:rhox homeobox family member 2B-like [Apodemus sylvaticus]|uniref:rhox homeobox family member 2B-like n=1 Tax=Apodemus sylvaticus TaxID=10129 RepID=UPI0022437F9F|nr:rhox homeobox family member 2B-like [Apodemus sylvaticus]